MAQPQQVYREFARRGHRLLAAYLAMYAWVNDLECVAIERNEMLAFWGFRSHVPDKRLDWFKVDVRRYFRHVKVFNIKGGGRFAGIFLSRTALPPRALEGTMRHEKRVRVFTSEFEVNTATVKLPGESVMLQTLTSAVHGISSFPLDGET